MNEELEKIKQDLHRRIISLEDDKEDMDEVSWGYQNGILISGNDAKTLLAEIERLKKDNETSYLKGYEDGFKEKPF